MKLAGLSCAHCGNRTSIFSLFHKYPEKYCSLCKVKVALQFNTNLFFENLLWLAVGEVFLFLLIPAWITYCNYIFMAILALIAILTSFELSAKNYKVKITVDKNVTFPEHPVTIKLMIISYIVSLLFLMHINIYGLDYSLPPLSTASLALTVYSFVAIASLYGLLNGYAQNRIFIFMFGIVNVPAIIRCIDQFSLAYDFNSMVMMIATLCYIIFNWLALILMFMPASNRWFEACHMYRLQQPVNKLKQSFILMLFAVAILIIIYSYQNQKNQSTSTSEDQTIYTATISTTPVVDVDCSKPENEKKCKDLN